MKKRVVLLVSALSSITMLLATVVGVSRIGNISPLSASLSADIELNSANSPLTSEDSPYASKDKVYSFGYHSDVKIHYTSVKYASDSHVRLENNGQIYPVSLQDESIREESRSLSSITVTYKDASSVVIRSAYTLVDNTITGNSTYFNIYATSGTTYQVRGNYWEIIALNGSATIESIAINYGCSEASSSLDTNSVTVSSLNSSTSFADIKEENNNVYYRIKGSYANGEFNASNVVIKDDKDESNSDNTYPISAERIEYRENNTFVMWFNLSANRETLIGSSHYIYVPHLFINNVAWDNDHGDVKNGTTPDSSSIFKEGYYYNTYCKQWAEGTSSTYGTVAFNIQYSSSVNYEAFKSYKGKISEVEDKSRANQNSGEPWKQFYVRFFIGSEVVTPTVDDIKIYHDDKRYEVSPYEVQYWNKSGRGGTVVHAWFDMEQFVSDTDRYYCHLYYKDYPIDDGVGGSNGDLKVASLKWNDGEKTPDSDDYNEAWSIGNFKAAYRWKMLTIYKS